VARLCVSKTGSGLLAHILQYVFLSHKDVIIQSLVRYNKYEDELSHLRPVYHEDVIKQLNSIYCDV